MSGISHIVALSGGKDSTAMALRLAEIEPRDYLYVCTPTGNEPDEMFEHWRRLGDLLGKSIMPIMMAGGLAGLIRSQNALPNWRQRWCTRLLKIEPFAAFLMQHPGSISYVGLRADEPEREGGDYLDVGGTMDFPMRRWGWGLREVLDYLFERGIAIPKRTDCKICFYQRLFEWWELWRDDPAAWAEGEAWEAMTGHTFRSPGRDTWPTSMAALRAKFETGAIPRQTGRDAPDLFSQSKCRVCRL